MTQSATIGEKRITVSDIQFKCLKLLFERHEYDEDILSTFRSIAENIGISERAARVSVRALKRKGLAEYSQAYNEDVGFCGSGHMITALGIDFLTLLFSNQ